MPPKKKYTVKARIKRIRKAQPIVVEPQETRGGDPEVPNNSEGYVPLGESSASRPLSLAGVKNNLDELKKKPVEEDIYVDIYVPMPSKKKYTLKAKIRKKKDRKSHG